MLTPPRPASGVQASKAKIMAHDPAPISPNPPNPVIDDNHLIWIDMEMSGLHPDSDRVLEIAVIVTDSNLATVAEGPIVVVHQAEAVLDGMDAWNKATHARSGLVERVRQSSLDDVQAEAAVLGFLARYVRPGKSPMCGNSICQDRRFLARWMPRLEAFFHYRNLDVSTLKELAKRWKPEVHRSFEKKSRHEALADVYESIAEMQHYRDRWLMAAPAVAGGSGGE
jgi:oligoribonuclease